MTNLVPLHIDKDTGDIIATGNIPTTGGGGGGTSAGFLYEQLTPATIWVIVHNAGSEQLICQVYDNTGELILPDSIKILDSNTVRVDFTAGQIGKAHILFFDVV